MQYDQNSFQSSNDSDYEVDLYRYNSEHYFKKVIRQILGSIKLLHDQGIVHRDLKLENVMLKSNKFHELDSIRIIDFGLSKRFDPRDKNPTKFKSVVGTPHFVSP